MKRIIKIMAVQALVVMLFATACKKDFSIEYHLDPTLSINDTSWSAQPINKSILDTFTNQFSLAPMRTYFNANIGANTFFGDSIQLICAPGSFVYTNTNTLIDSATIDASLLFLKKKGDIIRYLINTGNLNNVLECNGIFKTQFSSNGIDASLANGKSIALRFWDNDTTVAKSFYYGASLSNSDSLFTWKLGDNNDGIITQKQITAPSGITKSGFEVSTHKVDWISSAATINTGATTRITASLSPNFTNKNTVIFAVWNDKNSVIRLTPNYYARSFYADHIMLNSAITLVSISLIDKQYYLGTTGVTVTSSTNYISVHPDLKPVSLSEIVSLLNAL